MVELNINGDVEDLLTERGLEISEVEDIVETAEETNEKLRNDEGVCCAKEVGENLTCYAVYEESGDGYNLLSAYAHKMKVEGPTDEDIEPDGSEWECVSCGTTAVEGNVDLSYLGITRPVSGIVCPDCGTGYVPENVAVDTLPVAEETLEEKRA